MRCIFTVGGIYVNIIIHDRAWWLQLLSTDCNALDKSEISENNDDPRLFTDYLAESSQQRSASARKIMISINCQEEGGPWTS